MLHDCYLTVSHMENCILELLPTRSRPQTKCYLHAGPSDWPSLIQSEPARGYIPPSDSLVPADPLALSPAFALPHFISPTSGLLSPNRENPQRAKNPKTSPNREPRKRCINIPQSPSPCSPSTTTTTTRVLYSILPTTTLSLLRFNTSYQQRFTISNGRRRFTTHSIGCRCLHD